MRLLTSAEQLALSGKAGNLARLQVLDLPVPPFSTLAFEFTKDSAYQAAVEAWQAKVIHSKDPADSIPDFICQFLQREATSILDQFKPDGLYSVRSSASIEDGPQHSFAGQFTSLLNVAGRDLAQAVNQVVASFYQPEVLAYLSYNELSLADLEPYIIIQEMVAAEYSGIYFTANPRGLLNEHLLVVGAGLGNQVVEDKVAVTTYSIHPQDEIILTSQSGSAAHLSRQVLQKLQELATRIQSHYQQAMDIEFALANDQIWLLQARPITQLSPEPRYILDNANIVESYPGLTSPLTYSFIRDIAYYKVFEGLGRRLVQGREDLLAVYQACFSNMVVSVNSRIYYRLDNFYHLLRLLPGASWLIPIWQDMLGIRQRQLPDQPIKISLWQRIKVGWQLIKALKHNDQRMTELDQDFQSLEQYYRENFRSDLSMEELKDLFQELQVRVLEQWDLTLINDLYAFIFTGLVKKRIGQLGQIAGIDQIDSMKPTRALNQLVTSLKEYGAEDQVEAWIRSDNLASDLLEKTDQPAGRLIQDYIERYGDRVPEELKLETHTFRSHPIKLLTLLQALLKDSQLTSTVTGPNNNLFSEVRNPYDRFLIRQAKLGIRHRESSRLNRTRLYGMTRSIFRSLGQRLVEQDLLTQVDDIFYLTMTEIMADEFPYNLTDLTKIVAVRREKFDLDRNLPAYSRLIFSEQIFEKNPHEYLPVRGDQHQTDWLYGIASSPGRVRGQIIRIEDVQQIPIEAVKDKIIVCKMTDPGWVFLLMQAKGIIAEQGSLLSHTAIISRELKIPAVVNVNQAMDVLVNNQWVELDGNHGQIQIMKEGDLDGD